jgi:hypothetical protein
MELEIVIEVAWKTYSVYIKKNQFLQMMADVNIWGRCDG